MGYFSWKVNGVSLPNVDSSRKTFTVFLTYKDLDGNVISVKEDAYQGYGEFGGMDYYVALAMMNLSLIDLTKDEFLDLMKTESGIDKIRSKGIDIAFDESINRLYNISFPQLDTIEGGEHTDFTTEPVNCPNQGYFYDDGDGGEDDDEEDEW